MFYDMTCENIVPVASHHLVFAFIYSLRISFASFAIRLTNDLCVCVCVVCIQKNVLHTKLSMNLVVYFSFINNY